MGQIPRRLRHIHRKLERAREQIDAADAEARSFFQSQFYTTRIEHERKSPWWLLVVEKVKPIPPEIGIYAGEAAHHLRSSLDHLMWFLANPPTPRAAKNVEFPIAHSRREFVGRRGETGIESHGGMRHKVPGVARGVRATVERLQPYRSGQCQHADTLGQLREISNWDKHRALAIVAASVEVTRLDVRIDGHAEVLSKEAFTGILKPDAELARVKVRHVAPKCIMHMKVHLDVQPFLDETMPPPAAGVNLMQSLYTAGWFIEHSVIKSLKRFL